MAYFQNEQFIVSLFIEKKTINFYLSKEYVSDKTSKYIYPSFFLSRDIYFFLAFTPMASRLKNIYLFCKFLKKIIFYFFTHILIFIDNKKLKALKKIFFWSVWLGKVTLIGSKCIYLS